MSKMTMQELVNEYYKSSDYSMLAVKTKVDYTNCLESVLRDKSR